MTDTTATTATTLTLISGTHSPTAESVSRLIAKYGPVSITCSMDGGRITAIGSGRLLAWWDEVAPNPFLIIDALQAIGLDAWRRPDQPEVVALFGQY